MRKQNAEWKTAFLSEANQALRNTDYVGFVELDAFACYVIADGMDDQRDGKAARLAIETIVAAFEERPSMKKRTIRACLKAANQAFLQAKSRSRFKGSVTMLVTDYTSFRYGQAGNTRLRLYRNGKIIEKSKDHSLSMDFLEERRIGEDLLSRHEERNNLTLYLGKHAFRPFVSKKIGLQNADILSLYTRGVWEQLDEGELEEAIAEASTEPQETLDVIEDLLLSKQETGFEKYTIALLFVNKIYTDPNRKRRFRKILMIGLPILVLALTLTIFFWIRFQNRKEKRETMEASYLSAVEYVQSNNYVRAKTEVEKAKEAAESLNEETMKTESDTLLKLVEAVLLAEEKLEAKQYLEAQEAYQKALNRSRYADLLGEAYITGKIEQASQYASIYELLTLGDELKEDGLYEAAEKMYQDAKTFSGRLLYEEGRKSALSALESLYAEQAEQEKEKEEAVQEAVEQEAVGTNHLAQGDAAFAKGEYEEALVYYTTAQQAYAKLGLTTESEAVEKKIAQTEEKQTKQAKAEEQAAGYLEQGDQAISGESKDFLSAKKYYLLAKEIYASLKQEDKLGVVERKLELLESKEVTADTVATQEEEQKKQEEEQKKQEEEQKQQEQEQKENAAGQAETLGDQAFAEGRFSEAKIYYQEALAFYEQEERQKERLLVTEKVKEAERKALEQQKRQEEAKQYEEQAEACLREQDFAGAEKYYLMADYVYSLLKDTEKLEELSRKLSLLRFEQEQAEKKAEEAAAAAQEETKTEEREPSKGAEPLLGEEAAEGGR